jgi:hypothetical protein
VRVKQIAGATVIGISLLGVGFWLGGASAAGTEPGSSADPLVSKSYVDQLVAKLADKTYVDQVAAGMAAKSYVDQAVSGTVSQAYVDAKVAELGSASAFAVVNVPKGATVLGESGTELVLRGGKATAVVSQKGGILDATGGADLFQDQAVPPNHLLIIPVSDGRGLYAQTDLILIVKGSYTVKVEGQ